MSSVLFVIIFGLYNNIHPGEVRNESLYLSEEDERRVFHFRISRPRMSLIAADLKRIKNCVVFGAARLPVVKNAEGC